MGLVGSLYDKQRYIAEWQKVFRHFDQDHSGSIDGAELAQAIRQFGFNLSPNLLSLLEQKYCALFRV